MFGEHAIDLVRELDPNNDVLPPFNEAKIRQVLEEMQSLFSANQADVNNAVQGSENRLMPTVQLRHSALERNRRCWLSYTFNRLQRIQQMRWEFGSNMPATIQCNLSDAEVQWFRDYNRILGHYLQSIGNGRGLDLTKNLKPPKSLYVAVRCLVDFGEFETDDGTVIVLMKDTQHFLQRSSCEHLIRQGILKHISL